VVKLSFYGGVNEIGGNKILLEDRDTRVFLDFGMSFNFGVEYFTGFLQPRRVNGLGDYFEFDLLPKLKGLYSEGLLANTPLEYVKPRFEGVILSHAHIDHFGHTSFLDENIPLFCGEGTKIILEALKESGGYDYGEHICKTFRTGKKLRVGNMEIEPVHVDHSIPAAYGFIIHTCEGTIVYTGDFRLHGPMSRMTKEFAEKAESAEPVAMICEGTRINPQEKRTIHSEEDVRKLANSVVERSHKIVICAFYGRDIDRFKTFYNIAEENDRKFIISTKTAHLLSKLKSDPRLKVPDVMSDGNILVYVKRKRSGGFEESDYYLWERPFLDKAVTYDYIRKNQSKILLNLDFSSFAELIDIKPEGGDFIHSMSEPFSEEDIEIDVMHNWLKHFNLKFHQIHASGHCPSRDLRDIIEAIRPRKLFPVHTEEPEYFRKVVKKSQIIIPVREKPFQV
jgi:ribonuclease J